jgi:hypothetical protein
MLGANRNSKRDNIILKGQEILTVIRSNATSTNLPFNGTTTYLGLKPYTFGDRVTAVANVYTRYRYRSLRFEYKTHVGSTTVGALALGVADDSNNTDIAGNIGGIYDPVVNLRCSGDNALWKNFTFMWTPLDKSKWYYTDTSGTDPRFDTQACILAAFDVNRTDNLLLGEIRVHYVVEFMGAKPVYNVNLKNKYEAKIVVEPETKNDLKNQQINRWEDHPLRYNDKRYRMDPLDGRLKECNTPGGTQ